MSKVFPVVPVVNNVFNKGFIQHTAGNYSKN